MAARVVSVFGPFNSRVLVDMSADEAKDLFPDGFAAASRSAVLDAALRDVERLRARDRELADSALAASAVAMAYEIEHPYNSATSKSMCQARLADTLRELRELAPPERERDAIDELEERRGQRRAGVAKTADLPGA